MFKHILVAIDGSPASDQGLKVAVELAADQRAVLTIVHVIDDQLAVSSPNDLIPFEYVDRAVESLRAAGRQLLARAQSLACARGVDTQIRLVEVFAESAAQAIVAQASDQKVDLIVLGTHGRRGLRRMLLGSDAEAVLRESPAPVLLVRAQETTSPQAKPAAPAARASSPAPEAAPITF